VVGVVGGLFFPVVALSDNDRPDFFGASFFEDTGAFEDGGASGSNIIDQENSSSFYFSWIYNRKSFVDILMALGVIFKTHLGKGVALANQEVIG
jgi:hypothetical protein